MDMTINIKGFDPNNPDYKTPVGALWEKKDRLGQTIYKGQIGDMFITILPANKLVDPDAKDGYKVPRFRVYLSRPKNKESFLP